MKIRILLLALLVPVAVVFGQDELTFEPDRNVSPEEQYGEKNPSNDAQVESDEDKAIRKLQRIKTRFGDSEGAVLLLEEAEQQRNEWQADQVREKLTEAKDQIEKVKSRGISQTKRKQLAGAWARLAKSERLLFGDTDNNLEWLRTAYDLDPDNEEVARALGIAERKQEYALARLEAAAQFRASREQQN